MDDTNLLTEPTHLKVFDKWKTMFQDYYRFRKVITKIAAVDEVPLENRIEKSFEYICF